MKNIVNKVLLPHKKKKIIVSVSGGIDSLVLLDILINLKLNIVVVNFNHQQRKESLIEAEYIKDLCLKENIPFEYFLLNISENENFQSASSKLRKKHLVSVAKKYKTDVVVTAHHLNDLAETVLLKLSRGSNLLGYAGMQQSYKKDNVYLIKPLLYVSKETINDYAKNNNIKYFLDESNLIDSYTRNKIRLNVMPYLIKENPAFLNKIIDYNKQLSSSFKYIRKETLRFLNNSLSFNASSFKNLDEALKFDVIAYLLEEKNLNITNKKIEMILEYINNSGPNSTLDLGNSYEFVREYDSLFIEKKTVLKPFKQELYFDKENILPNGDVIIINNKISGKVSNHINICYNKKVQPLYARSRKPGDVLYFSYGHKKLKKFYIDEKVPLKERQSDVLIVDNNDNILAILGRYVNCHEHLKDTFTLIYRRKHNEFRQSN